MSTELQSSERGVPARLPDHRPATGGRNPRKIGRNSRFAAWWWAAPAVLLVLGIHYAAVGAGATYAFTNWNGLSDAKFVGLANFQRAFTNDSARTALFNTLLLAVLFVIITNVIGMLFALALNRTLKSRYFLRVLLFMPVVLSPLAVAYVWKFIFQQTGPLNDGLQSVGLSNLVHTWLADPNTAIWTVLVVMVWQSMGLAMVIYLAGLATVPPELEEAAAVDGAGMFARFRSVTLPLVRPSVVIASTLLLIRGLGVFDQVIALTAGGPYGATETLATLVYKQTFVAGRYGYGAALSLMLTVLIGVFAVLQIVLLRNKED